jgi:hypothetical protein
MKGMRFTAKEKERALKMWLNESTDITLVAHRMKCTERTL